MRIAPPFAAGALGGNADPFFSNVVQMAHFNGSNLSTTFTNSCSRGTTLVAQSPGPILSTSQVKFGTASLAPATDVGAACPPSSDYFFGTGDFTIEFWAYISTQTKTNGQGLVDMRPGGTNGVFPTILVANGGALDYLVSSSVRITGGSVSINTWHAIALSRVSGVSRLYLDGSQTGSSFTDANNFNVVNTRIVVGNGSFGSTGLVSGFIDELRVTNGVGRYSGTSYTPAGPFPNH